MNHSAQTHYAAILDEIRAQGLYKEEAPFAGAQGELIRLPGGRELVNLCANNYLGWADHPRLRAAAAAALDQWGYGVASVRFICGTQQLHEELEAALSRLVGAEATILYSSCFDANGGLFETLLTAEDAVISDELNHASIIDGIRLSKAQRFRYRNRDMNHLEDQLKLASSARVKLIATDGSFSMDGTIAPLAGIYALADRYGALVMVDDSHSLGVIGATGRGTAEHCGLTRCPDVLTGTFGKALGGASGGFVSASRTIVDLLRQRSRPYLFSNSLAPMIAAATLEAIRMLEESPAAVTRLHANTRYFRDGMAARGFALSGDVHPIAPVILGDELLSAAMARAMFDQGIYVRSFSYPVVPRGKARIRTQISAAHSLASLDRAIAAFVAARESTR
jgi:glycine C-acetyltransferase